MPTSYPNIDNPIANSFVKEQVSALTKENLDIVVLNVRKQPTSKLFKKVDEGIGFENDGCTDIVYKRQKTFAEKCFAILNQMLFNHSMKRIYQAAVNKFGVPDLIYAHFYGAAVSAIKITKGQNIPIVTLEHSGLIMSEKLDLRHKYYLKKAVEGSNKYIVTTEGLKKYVKKHTKTQKELDIIPNVIDDSFSFAERKEKENFVFFSVARLDFDKRLDLLIESFAKTFTANENVSLRIGGGGPEYRNLKSLITFYKREHQIILLDRLNRDEVKSEMVNCDAFVLPSRHETFGIVWREAMCIGRPVITTNHGGFGQVDFKNKTLFKPI